MKSSPDYQYFILKQKEKMLGISDYLPFSSLYVYVAIVSVLSGMLCVNIVSVLSCMLVLLSFALYLLTSPIFVFYSDILQSIGLLFSTGPFLFQRVKCS